ncbi:CFC_HP_G0068340.mRNA.1.CDS.1 [Saccharomyces cerevisiae]|nr:CFC_HP_G0068340.mRNA.1.CDS.1 [Saccharomyces cerevisiae]CAI6648715.1 CFC_HP_G0068340.mRNA.1.CDS.1 [Saccharomyces cerevisiae]
MTKDISYILTEVTINYGFHRGRTLNIHTSQSHLDDFRLGRERSNARFKGLRRVLTHDGTLDNDYFNKHNVSQEMQEF